LPLESALVVTLRVLTCPGVGARKPVEAVPRRAKLSVTSRRPESFQSKVEPKTS
jgi:hypothetical protein